MVLDNSLIRFLQVCIKNELSIQDKLGAFVPALDIRAEDSRSPTRPLTRLALIAAAVTRHRGVGHEPDQVLRSIR